VATAPTASEIRAAGRRHPLYRAIRAAWWVIAIWLGAAVLVGVIRGTFIDGPAKRPPAPPGTSSTLSPPSTPSPAEHR